MIPRRSRPLFIVVAAVAVVLLAANAVAAINFPPNAPVEQITAFGITVDLVVLLVGAAVGAGTVGVGGPSRPRSVLSTLGLCFTAVVLLAVLALPWADALFVRLPQGTLMHYGDMTFIAFLAAGLWVTGTLFGAFGYRVGGIRAGNIQALLAIVFGLAVGALAATSAVIYGLGLST